MRPRLPSNIGFAVVVAEPCPNKAKVGEAVDKFQAAGVDFGTVFNQCNQFTFAATGDRAGQVQGGGCAAAAGQDKILCRFQLLVGFLQPVFEQIDLELANIGNFFRQFALCGCCQFAAEVEQLILQLQQLFVQTFR